MGKSWLQDLIIEEARELVQDLEKTKAEPVNASEYLTPSVANVICAISFGQRFRHTDATFRRLTNLIGTNIQIGAKNQLVEYFPFLRFLPFSPFRSRYQAWWTNIRQLTAFLQTLVDQHQLSLHDGEPRDYIDAFMLESEKQKNESTSSFTSELFSM
jgi:cytochrome P450